MGPDELRELMEQTASAQLEIQRALAEMGEDELWKLKGQLEDQLADLDAELRLLSKAIAIKEARADA